MHSGEHSIEDKDIRQWFGTGKIGSYVRLKNGLIGMITRVSANCVYVAIGDENVLEDIAIFPDGISHMLSRELVRECIRPLLDDEQHEAHFNYRDRKGQ